MSRLVLVLIIVIGLGFALFVSGRWQSPPAAPSLTPTPNHSQDFGPTLAPNDNELAPGIPPVIDTPFLKPTLGQNPVFQPAVNSQVGQYLTDLQGHALYLFNRDSAGESTCEKECAQSWPPYVAPASAAGNSQLPDNVTLVTRTDGNLQYALDGLPLYFFIGDKLVGDAKGNGLFNFGGLWFLAKP